MDQLISVYKPVGYTPLEVVQALRKEMPEYKDISIGYAGRLDPLAHGVLLLMIADAAKERDRYLGLVKEYEFEVLFGVRTDSYDVLGLIEKTADTIIVNKNVEIFVKNNIGKFLQPYPPFSSKAVDGKPLFQWAKEGKLSQITMPQRSIEIYSFDSVSFGEIAAPDLQKKITTHIQLVKGDFRQQQIVQNWQAFFAVSKKKTFQTAKFHISCSSGTYVRGIINEMGLYIGYGALALDILRTRVGEYRLADTIKLRHIR